MGSISQIKMIKKTMSPQIMKKMTSTRKSTSKANFYRNLEILLTVCRERWRRGQKNQLGCPTQKMPSFHQATTGQSHQDKLRVVQHQQQQDQQHMKLTAT